LISFEELGLSNQVLRVISELGFENPSEIQAEAIPQLIEGQNDFIGLAQTGTGKTAAFGLPLLERIDPSEKSTQALILAPTRELGQQIAGQMEIFGKYLKKINILAVYGGASITQQMQALRKPQHVIIATPGRLIDLIQRKAVKLNNLKFLVLDEADEMLNMGFKQELDKILSYTPAEKLIWLFSATMSREITRIVKTYMDSPVEVKLNLDDEVNVNIEHQYTLVKQSDKAEALTRFLDVDPGIRGVVFCRTKGETQSLADALQRQNYKADALHGDLSQRQRDQVMKRFKAHQLQVLIATDIAARGIDVDDLTHVFHFTLPDDIAYYTHRSGRTARAGKKGISLAFINGRDRSKINRIMRDLDISFERVFIPVIGDIHDTRIENWCQQILETPLEKTVDQQLLNKVNTILGELSREELTAKLVQQELDRFASTTTKDLNERQQRGKKERHPHPKEKPPFHKHKRKSRRRNSRNKR